MRNGLNIIVAAVVLMSGCSSDGLSPREDSTNSLPAAVYHQADPAPATQVGDQAADRITVAQAKAIKLPIRVGVIQVGEVAPPESMLTAFGKRPDLFNMVEPMPGNMPGNLPGLERERCESRTDDRGEKSQVQREDPIRAIRKTAGEMGLDYVLIYGGTVDCSRTPTPLEVFNLTIVGAFIVPSDQVLATGKSAGTLIEVASGHVVMNFSADAKGSAFLPSIEASEVYESMRIGVREDLIRKMTQQTLDRLSALHGH